MDKIWITFLLMIIAVIYVQTSEYKGFYFLCLIPLLFFCQSSNLDGTHGAPTGAELAGGRREISSHDFILAMLAVKFDYGGWDFFFLLQRV